MIACTHVEAEVGAAWWLLCQFSPASTHCSQGTLRAEQTADMASSYGISP